MSIKGYSLGFMFDRNDRVVLIRKAKPEWQAGFLNGVGGKIEAGETPYQCMRREFAEEAGVVHDDWQHVLTMEGPTDQPRHWQVHVFRTFVEDLPDLAYPEDGEVIEVHDADGIPDAAIPNLRWLIPLCRDREISIAGVC